MLGSNYKVVISHIKDNDDKVIYLITVRSTGDSSKVTQKRYSELKEFNEGLAKLNSFKLPEFPKRKLFGKTNKSEESILNRQIELQKYFNELLSIDAALTIPQVQDFLPDAIKRRNSTQSPNFIAIAKKNISVMIERYSVYDDVVIYFMRITNKETKEEWVTKQRYSELKKMHDELLGSKLKNSVPAFPKSKLFGTTNENPENIEKRREDLENYLNAVFQMPEIGECWVAQQFLINSKKEFEKSRQVSNKGKTGNEQVEEKKE